MTGIETIDIGSRRELFVDDYLLDSMTNVQLRLHEPIPREVALVTDRPWEGCGSGFITVFRDGDRFRMYYKAWHQDVEKGTAEGKAAMLTHGLFVAYAESADGVHWERPNLGLYEFEGSMHNNLVWVGEGPNADGTHGFAPFRDSNPVCPEETRYKAVGAGRKAKQGGLYALISPDGIHWSKLQSEPVIADGNFDSQNLAFWDAERGEYRAYWRDKRDGRRDIRTATSPDFVHWSDGTWLEYPGAPDEQLYTNQVIPYFRAPHLFVGFPSRYVQRPWSPAIEALPGLEQRRLRASISERFGAAVTDGLFMSSRDGVTFKRWGEAFIRPGPQLKGNWVYGDNYQCWGMVETPAVLEGAPPELSFYATEDYWSGNSAVFRRYTIRIDGFVSVQAPRSGGEFATRPLIFEGNALSLNVATSAAGSVKVEVQDETGRAVPGFALDDCIEVIGDRLDHRVRWRGDPDLAALAGKPVRLRFVMCDAELYAMQFQGEKG